MGDHLRVDTAVLNEAGATLRLVASEFEHAGDSWNVGPRSAPLSGSLLVAPAQHRVPEEQQGERA